MIACKKMRKYCLFPIVLILTLIPCVLPAQGISPETNSLSSQLDTLIKYQLPAGSNVSISAYDLTANKVLYDYQADKLSRPASTMKLLTTITALARPEADEPFRTEVWYKGVIERDTLKGIYTLSAASTLSLTTRRWILWSAGWHGCLSLWFKAGYMAMFP